ncbi:MAG: hypothetical protein JO016_12060 [Actinobacteria bacterium]|nr:hypothetical protein [Actinomycetota bacterium]
MSPVAPPSDYQLVLPDGWFRIDLEPGTREQAAAALIERQFRGADDIPHLKAEARDKLLVTAADAYGNGGIELYVSLQAAAGMPLPAALVVTLTPPHPDERVTVTPELLAATLAATAEPGGAAADGGEITTVELAAGRAVRVRRFDPPVTRLDLHVPIPDSGAWLLLSFSTPLAPLADALVGMFDAVAGTLRWMS